MKLTQSFLLILVSHLLSIAYGFLEIKGEHFVWGNEKIFLSGVNTPWVHYARDFGSGAYKSSKPTFDKWLAEVAAAGGNAVRVWVHIDGQWSPKFNAQGLATGEDTKSLIDELSEFLTFAEKHSIFVILCLWNGAVKPTHMLHLYSDPAKLEHYIAKVLKPMVAGLKHHKSLAAWEIVNEVEGSVKPGIKDANKCFDTENLVGSGANWANTGLTMKEALRFINLHADAIKETDPKALVTSGAWSERSNTDDCVHCHNYYKNECLHGAGGKPKGVLDFYQIHTYTNNGKYNEFSPMKKTAAAFKLNKPLIIGEFSVKCSESKNAVELYSHAYNGGYSGALSWAYDGNGQCSDGAEANPGMKHLEHQTKSGVIRIKI
jgi:mannan endo-1,4-beta-mannosidase